MKIGHWEFVVHWGSSFALDYSRKLIKLDIYSQVGDIYLKLGRILIVVSDINKTKQHLGRVPKI